VAARVHASKQTFVHIEEIQDMVQEELMKAGHYKVAEAYILYRAERGGRPVMLGLAPAGAARAPGDGRAGGTGRKATMVVVKARQRRETYFWDGD
jgi:ribonucleoside-diphosphate reductase alpha chain